MISIIQTNKLNALYIEMSQMQRKLSRLEHPDYDKWLEHVTLNNGKWSVSGDHHHCKECSNVVTFIAQTSWILTNKQTDIGYCKKCDLFLIVRDGKKNYIDISEGICVHGPSETVKKSLINKEKNHE